MSPSPTTRKSGREMAGSGQDSDAGHPTKQRPEGIEFWAPVRIVPGMDL